MQTITDTTSQYRHDVLVQMNHDEEARQDFVRCFKLYLAQNVSPGNKKVFEEKVEPQLKSTERAQSLAEIDRLMKQQEYYQFWSSLQRCSQEMMWNAVQIPVERQLPKLVEVAREFRSKPKLGSLTLNPDL